LHTELLTVYSGRISYVIGSQGGATVWLSYGLANKIVIAFC